LNIIYASGYQNKADVSIYCQRKVSEQLKCEGQGQCNFICP